MLTLAPTSVHAQESPDEAMNPLLTFQAGGDDTADAGGDISPGLEIELRQIRNRLRTIEGRLDAMAERIESLVTQINESKSDEPARRRGKSSKGVEAKIEKVEKALESLEKTYKSHTHEVLYEARTRNGQVENLQQGAVGRSGAIPTGRTRIGKPK